MPHCPHVKKQEQALLGVGLVNDEENGMFFLKKQQMRRSCYIWNDVSLKGPSFWQKAHESSIYFLSCGATWATGPFTSYSKRDFGGETNWPILQVA